MKLWQKETTSISALVEKFSVGRDKEFDILLAKYDVEGSIAHVTMLGEVGLMTKDEAGKAIAGLKEILKNIHHSQFTIHHSPSHFLRKNWNTKNKTMLITISST
jgi:argininosuccinate lyase